MMGQEAIEKGVSLLLSPNVNIQRSPLSGRGFESFGEDPTLAGKIAASIIQGIQSTGVVSVIKHFVAIDKESQRQISNAIIPARTLREVYLLPFQIAQKEAKPKGYMTAHNGVNGTHAGENAQLLRDILREEWGFDGLVVSDWYGINSSAKSMNTGLDVEMPGPPSRLRGSYAKIYVKLGNISANTLDNRVRAVLKTINHVAPLWRPENVSREPMAMLEKAQLLRQTASSGIVLLKNNGMLPLSPETTTAIIGPNAKFAAYSGGGSAALRPYYAVTPFEGVQAYMPNVRYALGATAYKKLPPLTAIAKAPDGTPGMEMRIYLECPWLKDVAPIDRFNIDSADCFLDDYKHPALTSNLFFIEVEGTITPEADAEYLFSLTVDGSGCLFVNGDEIVDNETVQTPGDSFSGFGTAEEVGSMHLLKGRKYTILVQCGTAPTSKINRGSAGKMGIGGMQIGGCIKTDPVALLDEAVTLAKQVDQVILCVGLYSEWESQGWDRAHMDLPPGSDALVEAVTAANPNVVVVNQSGTPVTMPWVDKVSAIVQAWYGGNETGNAIADVLFGEVNPSGKLPFSWPARLENNPAFANTITRGNSVLYGESIFVGYRWYDMLRQHPLFAFGHGLSYTQFVLDQLSVEEQGPDEQAKAGSVLVTVKVTNVGPCDGDEVVQVYIAHQTATAQRPWKELKGFDKVHVMKGRTTEAEILLDKKYACSFWDETVDSWVMEQGTYHVWAGNSSRDASLHGQFVVQKTHRWNGL